MLVRSRHGNSARPLEPSVSNTGYRVDSGKNQCQIFSVKMAEIDVVASEDKVLKDRDNEKIRILYDQGGIPRWITG